MILPTGYLSIFILFFFCCCLIIRAEPPDTGRCWDSFQPCLVWQDHASQYSPDSHQVVCVPKPSQTIREGLLWYSLKTNCRGLQNWGDSRTLFKTFDRDKFGSIWLNPSVLLHQLSHPSFRASLSTTASVAPTTGLEKSRGYTQPPPLFWAISSPAHRPLLYSVVCMSSPNFVKHTNLSQQMW